MTNLSVIELENESLRARLRDIKSAASALVGTVERYVRQECLRTELLNAKENLKNILK